ncbi:PREDICTED: dentin sialophosphoprotein isoform X2 [Tarenaya hassleriana]|nr:PREDICTED: dentin sialophosphoprotein isoform X2 [Tarenaya hassleriana]
MKMRSVEAEQRTKSRKAIVLDPGNPSLTKQLALAEANPWRTSNKLKKEPPHKKRKVDPSPVPIGGPKPAFKPGASTAAGKGRPSASPGPSPNQTNDSPSPYGIGNLAKSHTATEDVPPVQSKSKENPVVSEKDPSTRATNALRDTSGNKANNSNKPIDLQTLMINLLKDAPMSLKALEKAVGDKTPNAVKKIEPVLKKIANFQAPGKYFLKSSTELESYKKISPERGSSPEDEQLRSIAECSHDQSPVRGADNVENVSVSEFTGKCEQDGMPIHPEELSSSPENVDIERLSPGIVDEGKASENRGGQAGSSSYSGSGSDNSDSGSSSDSEDSSNSKEGSDEDVDIISDDDREPRHIIVSAELGLPALNLLSQTEGCGIGQNESAKNQEGDRFDAVDSESHSSDAVDIEVHDSDTVDIEKSGSDAVDIEGHSSDNSHGSDGVKKFYSVNNGKVEATIELSPAANEYGGNLGQEPFSSDHDKPQECQNFIGRLFDDTDNMVKGSFNNEQSDSPERRARGKTNRCPDLEHFNQKSERVKRLKAESTNQFPTLGKDSHPSESMYDLSPNKCGEEPIKASTIQMIDSADKGTDVNCDTHGGLNKATSEKSNSDFQPSSLKVPKSTQIKHIDGSGRSDKHTGAADSVRKSTEGDHYSHEVLSSRTGKASRDNQRDSNHPRDKFQRNKMDGESDSKHAVPSDGPSRKYGELEGNDKDGKNVSGSSLGLFPLDNERASLNQRKSLPNFPAKGNGSMLQKTVSDLELGELREPSGKDTEAKKLEKKSSFRKLDNKPSNSESWDMDSDKRKPSKKSNFDSKKPSPPHAGNGFKGMPEQGVEDSSRSHKWGLQSHVQHHSGEDDKLEETNNKSRHNDSGARPGSSGEGCGETNKKVSAVASQQHGSKRGSISRSSRESKRHASGATVNLVNGQKGAGLIPNDSVDHKKRETSFDDEDCAYLKYEKASPELKGAIRNHSQYKAYIQEYQDKYGSYCSLNKILENFRNEFQKMGEDLEFAKGRDVERYNKLFQQLKESYSKYGERHKRLKKIFIVLHEELKHLKQRIKDYASSH